MDPTIPDRELILARLEHQRAFAGFSTPAGLGGLLALAVPVTLGLAIAARGWRRWVWYGVIGAQFGGLLSAASATATAALLGAVCLGALVWRAGRRTLWLALLAAMILLAAIIGLRGAEVLSSSHPNSPWRLRAGNFLAAASMARDHPWTGVGPGGFAETYPGYRRPGDNETRHAHNLPLELCAELGWCAGALLSLVFFWVFLRPLWTERDRSPPWRRGIAIGLSAFALQNLADFTAFLPSVLWTAVLLRGFTAAPGSSGAAVSASPARRALNGASLAVAGAAALLLATNGVADDLRHDARAAAFRGEPERAEKLAGRAAAWAPWDPEAALLFARASLLDPPRARGGEERTRLALARADRAVALSPVKPAAREFRAGIRLRLGDYPGAYADLVAASRLYPTNREYSRALSRLEEASLEAIAGAGAGP
jgi:hypothetical protein